MNKKNLTELVRLVVESVNEEIEDIGEMWFSTNEAGLTSEVRERLKSEIEDCLMEYIQECEDQSMQHDEPLIGPHGLSTTS